MNDETSSLAWDDDRLRSPHTQTDKRDRVRHMFDAIAPTYERVNTWSSAGRDRRWRERMVQLARVRPDDVLLDVACGTGDVARTFAAGAVRPERIIGLDFSLPMLELAARRPIDDGTFCRGDALSLPLADESVSIATCAFGVRNFQDLGRGLAEMFRVLKPGGRAVILEFDLPAARLPRKLYLFYFRRIMPVLATWISGDRTGAYRYLPQSVLSFYDREQIASLLRQAGFDGVSMYGLTFGIARIYVACRSEGTTSTTRIA